ncbi:MAG: ferritin family protein [Bacillota bacterium]
MFWKCDVCYHVTIGSTVAESCPVCGARKFSTFAPPTKLKGTATEQNLWKAFAGESQANRKYTAFAKLAEIAGHHEAAKAFAKSANDETAHALSLLAWLGGLGNTQENLKAAYDGESYENENMYPEFAQIARSEGFEEIATYFEFVGRQEKQHARAFDNLAKS